MSRRTISLGLGFVGFTGLAGIIAFAQLAPREAGVTEHKPGTCDGHTLLAPMMSKTTYLIDIQGNVVHTWESEYAPGQSVYLLDNGHLLRTANVRGNQSFGGGGTGGGVEEFDWDGNLVWSYKYSDKRVCQHHDIEPLPNGNVLILAWERKTREEAVAAGRDPRNLTDIGLWPDHIVEVKPERPEGGTIVWEWHLWDHLIQDIDASKANHGVVADHPELVNINPGHAAPRETPAELRKLRSLGYIGGDDEDEEEEEEDTNQSGGPGMVGGPGGMAGGPGGMGGGPGMAGGADWNHTNSIDYNPQLDQILVSVLQFNEIWVIDHSTTTAEAAGHKGGRSGKGG
ncbi:MAG: aryl-sulfate sulfotransferase, partial [Phycisphaerae bacterium]|nr:aryl-sulfate sulfotransferase [Phycisphaerae bacterium]